MLRQRKIRCCHAAVKPAILAECSEDQSSNGQTADFAVVEASPIYEKKTDMSGPGLLKSSAPIQPNDAGSQAYLADLKILIFPEWGS